ncbi:MAG: bifunctional phosphoglucose/phosphomannose isomerase [Candidatus Diapherotrites archaeon CG10_big_fil_rev_8_21_14_0_10_31_34]|nr:MAG: bifunctional phosphoglucose/phosphomannose isomerase [Candidatus Diapherotrites archaeon CG10_big_fil_rev_8_21_14_0_10_31_34]
MNEMNKYDEKNYFDLLENFPQQISEAMWIGKKIRLKKRKFENITVQGMGGSGITGKILENLFKNELKIPVQTVNDYEIPEYVSNKTLFIAVSYSGKTEETLSGLHHAKKKKAFILGISSGKKFNESSYFIKIPENYPPRAATAFLVVPLIFALQKLGLITKKEKNIIEFIKLAEKEKNRIKKNAFDLAEKMHNKTIFVYSAKTIEVCSSRWMTQINENSKGFCHANILPEMNHNEINMNYSNGLFVFLKTAKESSQMQKRIKFTKKVFSKENTVTEFTSKGKSLFAQLFYLIYLGDFTSYYLALLKKVDPSPVPIIEGLKKALK